MDFADLTAEQIDALSGVEREAWYAFKRRGPAAAAAILGAYETAAVTPPAPPAVAEVEAPVAETVTAEVRKRGRK